MGVKEALNKIVTLLDDVEVKGKSNMQNIVESINLVEQMIALLENTEKEVTENDDGH